MIDFFDHIADRTKDFTGREWVFAEIDRWLADENGAKYFLLTGEPGSGKTAIAARLAQFSLDAAQPSKNYSQIGSGFLAADHFCQARRAETTEPLEFTRNISRQLCAIDDFAKHLLDDSTIDLSNSVNIQENYGTVIGVKIENLIINSPSPFTAFVQTVIEPLKALYKHGYTRQVVILVDSLDEAAQFSARDTIVDLLASAGGLPPQVRFLLTTRPDPRVLRHFKSQDFPPFLLDAGGEQNQNDIRAYIQEQIKKSEKLRTMLAQAGISQSDFVDHAAQASDGNFLYLTWMLPEIVSGMHPEYLVAPPKDIYEIYLEYLRTRIKEIHDEWRKLYRPVMGTLMVAREPLSIQQVAAFSGLSPQDVSDSLLDLSQFFDPAGAGQGKYSLYHQSLSDFLIEQERAGEFWIDPATWHSKIIASYRGQAASWEKVDWRAVDDYGLRHIVAHLYALRHDPHFRPELHALVDEKNYLLGYMNLRREHIRRWRNPNPLFDNIRLALGLALEDDDFEQTWHHIMLYQRLSRVEKSLEHLVEAVEAGDYQAALERTSLYSAQPGPQAWARLWVAWLAATAKAEEAAKHAVQAALRDLAAISDLAHKTALAGYDAELERDQLTRTSKRLLTRIAHEIHPTDDPTHQGQYLWLKQLLEQRLQGDAAEYLDEWTDYLGTWAGELPAPDKSFSILVDQLEQQLVGLDPGAFRQLSFGLREQLAAAAAHGTGEPDWLDSVKRAARLIAMDDYPSYRQMTLAWLATGALANPSTEAAQGAMTAILAAALEARDPEWPEDSLSMALAFGDPACRAATQAMQATEVLESRLVKLAGAEEAKRSYADTVSAGRQDPWAWIVRRSSAIVAAIYRAAEFESTAHLYTILEARTNQHHSRSFAGYRALAYLSVAFRWLELEQGELAEKKIRVELAMKKIDQARKAAGKMDDRVLAQERLDLIDAAEGWINEWNNEVWPDPPGEFDVSSALRRAEQLGGLAQPYYLQFLSAIWANHAPQLKRLLPLALGNLTATDAVLGRLIGAYVAQGMFQESKAEALIAVLSDRM